MYSRRLEIMAFASLIIATAALVFSLGSSFPLSAQSGGGTGQSGAEPQDAEAVTEIPKSFNYQGFLRNPDGTLMSGNYNLELALYSAPIGGDPLSPSPWTWSDVPVQDGLFNVVIEDTGSAFTDNAPVYIGIKVNNGPELSPRQRVHPVPWALQANTAALALQANSASTANTLVDNASVNGLTANGTTNVTGSLFVQGDYPVLIKRWNNIYCPLGSCTISTGIPAQSYWCTMGGWGIQMDVNEGGSGYWSRSTYYGDGDTWLIGFYNNAHSTLASNVSVEIVCFRNGSWRVESGANSDVVETAAPLNLPVEPINIPADEGQ